MKESVVYINIITKYGCPQISYKQKIVLAPISLSNSAIFFYTQNTAHNYESK